jgi:hypothetical protein
MFVSFALSMANELPSAQGITEWPFPDFSGPGLCFLKIAPGVGIEWAELCNDKTRTFTRTGPDPEGKVIGGCFM